MGNTSAGGHCDQIIVNAQLLSQQNHPTDHCGGHREQQQILVVGLEVFDAFKRSINQVVAVRGLECFGGSRLYARFWAIHMQWWTH